MHDEKTINWFKRYGLEPPEHLAHIKDEDIAKNFKKIEFKNWRLSGNKLMADSDLGPYVHLIPTDYIMDGVDDNGLPNLKKIVI